MIVSAGPPHSELILTFITSVLTNHSPRGAVVEILRSEPEFAVIGLKADSLIRLELGVKSDAREERTRGRSSLGGWR